MDINKSINQRASRFQRLKQKFGHINNSGAGAAGQPAGELIQLSISDGLERSPFGIDLKPWYAVFIGTANKHHVWVPCFELFERDLRVGAIDSG